MKTLLLILATSLIFISCEKDDGRTIPSSEWEMAIEDKWAYESITAEKPVDPNGDGKFNTDLFNSQEYHHCNLDNIYYFYPSQKEWVISEGGRICDNGNNTPAYGTVEQGNYEFINGEIRFDNNKVFKISEMKDNKLKIETTQKINSENIKLTIVFYRWVFQE